MIRLCVLLPAYNEDRVIAQVVADVQRVAIDGVALQTLVVSDGSTDNTVAQAEAAGATVVSHPVNLGVGAAFRTGIAWAREQGFDALVHMDSDGQLLPSEIPSLWAPIARGAADLVVGSRFLCERPGGLDRWKALSLTTAARTVGLLTGAPITDLSCGFRCMTRKIMDVVHPTFNYDYIQETLLQAIAAGARIVEVPVTALYGESFHQAGLSARPFQYGRRFLWLTGWSLGTFYAKRAHDLFRPTQ